MNQDQLNLMFKSSEITEMVEKMPESTIVERKAKRESIKTILRAISVLQVKLSNLNKFQIGIDIDKDKLTNAQRIDQLSKMIADLSKERDGTK